MQGLIESMVTMVSGNPLLLAALAFVASAAEAVVVVGAVVPGTAILMAVAALAGAQGSASMASAILAAAILGAIVGDGFAYWLGRRFGRDLAQIWPLSRHPDWLSKGDAFFDRHGGKSVFWGRFIPGVKTVVPVVAGMSQMPVGAFLLPNVTSAILWGLGLVLAGLGIGRGLDRYGLADPRLLVLLAALLLSLAIAYWLLRALLLYGMPALARLRDRTVGWVAAHPGRGSAMALRLLSNTDGATVALLWASVSVAAIVGFLVLLGEVVFDAGVSQADAVISNAVQSLRFRALDAVMIAVTMAGDGIVLAALAIATLLWLLAARAWHAAGAAALAFGTTLLFVPLVKTLLGRQRPFALFEGADSFSFPSGHTSHSTVVFGIVAILVAHRMAVRARLAIYFAAMSLALMVALSRVYLGAHWPTDVAGGLLFGAATIAAVGYVLRGRPLAVRPGWMAIVLLLAYGGAYGLHMDRAYALWTVNYTHAPEIVRLTSAKWLESGWQTLPQRRITVDGAPTQPFLAQYAGEPTTLTQKLAGYGWSREQSTTTQSLLSMLLPYGDLGDLPPQIVLHDGQLPVLTLLTRSDATRRRLVLRFWSTSAILVDGSGPPRAIHLVDVSAETFSPVAFGFGDLEEASAGSVETNAVRDQIGAAFNLDPAPRQALSDSTVRPPLLLDIDPNTVN